MPKKMRKLKDKLLGYSMRLAVKKRYTVSQMEMKIDKWIFKKAEDEINLEDANQAKKQVLSRLIELNYLNDKEYVRDFVEGRSRNRPRGKFIIKRELMKKGVKFNEIENYFKNNEFDEIEVATRALRKKMKINDDLGDRDFKAKMFRYLKSKGFGLDVIYKATSHCYNQNESGIF